MHLTLSPTRDSSAGIATSYRLEGPGSIFRYFQFSFFFFLMFFFFAICNNVTHYVFSTIVLMYYFSVLFIVYVTLPPGIGAIAVGNKCNNSIIY
jgi:hypothetical protein